MSKHTDGKLRVYGSKVIGDEQGMTIGDLCCSTKDPDEVHANASRLVTCWNEHDDLVKERDELVAALRGLMNYPDGTYRLTSQLEFVRTAREILAKYPEAS